jgi:hypothetical protein
MENEIDALSDEELFEFLRWDGTFESLEKLTDQELQEFIDRAKWIKNSIAARPEK